ncbi:MAG: nucleoside permease [Planctomycetes bacterium]|nr:nucleoside permease [Planctomycetota bacterium]
MSWQVYLALSLVMFFEYAVWGAWAPVLTARLLGPLKMTGKQAGWIYATLPLACIFAPFVAGLAADRWVNAEWILIIAHLIGAVLLLAAARAQRFGSLLPIMLCYSLCYAATLPLVNSVLFAGTASIADEAARGAAQAKVFIWAPIAWALTGWSLTGWRMLRKTPGDGSDCLYLAAGLSIVMVLASALVAVLSPTPPSGGEAFPIQGVLEMLSQPNFLLFVVISMIVFGLMQFYFLGTAPFLQEKGIASKHVPGLMALAQIAQALATWFLFMKLIESLGFKWTLVIGAACWAALYGVYALGLARFWLASVQPLHGLAYVFFVIVGQKFTNDVSPEAIRSSMQALIFAATVGLGLFVGTQFAGFVMDHFSEEGKFQWRKVWLVPCGITVACVLIFAAAFQEPQPAGDQTAQGRPAASTNAVTVVRSSSSRGATFGAEQAAR